MIKTIIFTSTNNFVNLLGTRYLVDKMENANINTFLTLRKFIDCNSIRIGEVVKIFNTRSASGASLPESTNGGQIDRRVVYYLLIYIMLRGEGKYLKIIIYHHLVIYFFMCYTYDVSNRSIPGNIADNE